MSAPTIARYLEAFQNTARDEPAWLAERRRLAVERFSLLGFPTPRDEDYKYTNLKAISQAEWAAAGDPDGEELDLDSIAYAGEETARLIFVDGRPDLGWSRDESVTVLSIGEALTREAALLEGHLLRYADFESHALTALNTALFEDGAFVHIADRARVEHPIHIVWISTGGGGTVRHPRTLILAGRESEAQVVETFISLADGAAWTNQVTEIVAEEAARIEHFKVQQESLDAFHTGRIEGLEERNSYISTISLSFGALLARNDVGITLDDEGGECAIDGLYVVDGKQHVDHHTIIDHAKPNCNSHQLYKGILSGSARGVFNGKIIVRKDAQKTDAIQNNRNLLLSPKAEIDTKPQLEIDANDVRCTHGATIGRLSDDSLFYLRSRGIPEAEARGLLIYAFAADVLARITLEPLRLHFERLLMRTLAKDTAAAEGTIQ